MRNIQDNLPIKIFGVKEIANPEPQDELIQFLDTLGRSFGKDSEGVIRIIAATIETSSKARYREREAIPYEVML